MRYCPHSPEVYNLKGAVDTLKISCLHEAVCMKLISEVRTEWNGRLSNGVGWEWAGERSGTVPREGVFGMHLDG